MVKMRSKFEQIYDYLTNEVLVDMNAGDRLPTETKLAKDIGVSRLTLSKVLSALETEGRVIRRQGSGTFAAEAPIAPSSEKEKHIAVLIDRDITHPQLSYSHRRVSETLLRFFEDRGMNVKRYTGRKAPWEIDGEPTCEEFIDAVKADQIQAVVVICGFAHPQWAAPLQQRGVPIVGAWRSETDVLTNYPALIKDAVDYLYTHDRRKIALLQWRDPDPRDQHGQEIFQAFKEQMQEHRLPVRSQWIRDDTHPSIIGAGWQQFREVWSAPLDERPDSLIITDDILFREAASAILEIGIKVPDQLMVVTQTNKNSGMFYPLPVAKMEVNPDETARSLGEITMRTLANQSIDDISRRIGYRWIDRGQDNVAIDPVHSYSLSDFSERKGCHEVV